MRPFSLILMITILLSALTLGACSTPDATTVPAPTATDIGPSAADPTSSTDPTATSIPLTPTPTSPFPDDGPWDVTFQTEDGITLAGTLYGKDGAGIVLVPMYPGGKAGWEPFADAAADAGHRVLIFDLRGRGESGGDASLAAAPTDVKGAMTFLREQGTERMMLMGAVEGGVAALRAALEHPDVAGVAVLSSARTYGDLTISEQELQSLAAPMLWIGARTDLAHEIETMAEMADSPDESVWIYEGTSVQGTYLFTTNNRDDLQERLLTFAAQVSDE